MSVKIERCQQSEPAIRQRIVSRAEPERKPGAVMILVDRPASFSKGRLDRRDHLPRDFGRFGAALPAGAETRGAPDRGGGRAAYPDR